MAPHKQLSHCYDAIVVGAGIQGTCAAHQLAKRGKKTLLLEQFLLPHTRGSSHGQSRIIRSAYPEDHYVAMMAEAYRLWTELEAETGTKLYRPTTALILGHRENPEFQSYGQAMERHGIPSETLTPEALVQRFPGFHLRGGEMAISDHTAGVLYADKALKAVQDQFRRHGGAVRDGEKVLSVVPGAVVTVITNLGEHQARSLVVTAGAWAGPLLASLGLHLPLQMQRQCFTLSTRPLCEPLLGANTAGKVVSETDRGPILQGGCGHLLILFLLAPLPPAPPHRRLLLASETAGLPGRNALFPRYQPRQEPAPHLRLACRRIPGSGQGLSCWGGGQNFQGRKENTPDKDFVIDRHPRFRNIIIGAGFSGHGFKFAPVVGKILCQLCLGEEPSYDLAPFRISRFAGPPKASL